MFLIYEENINIDHIETLRQGKGKLQQGTVQTVWIKGIKVVRVLVMCQNSFLASIAAQYVAMSVSRWVGLSVGVNEFQRVLNALKVYVMNMLQSIIQYKIYLCVLCNLQNGF